MRAAIVSPPGRLPGIEKRPGPTPGEAESRSKSATGASAGPTFLGPRATAQAEFYTMATHPIAGTSAVAAPSLRNSLSFAIFTGIPDMRGIALIGSTWLRVSISRLTQAPLSESS